jgi:RNA polymerase sigma factor for flagellar operon FliA
MSSKGGEYEAIKNLSSEPVDVLQKIGLVKKIALYLKARVPDYMEVDDMVQIGMVGLMEASKSYDSSIGVTFDEYSKRRIKGAILDEVRKSSSLSRLAVKTTREYSQAKTILSNNLKKEPTNAEIAAYLDISISELEKRRSHANQMNMVHLEEDSAEWESAFEDEHTNPMLNMEQSELTERVAAEISKLDDRSKLILSLYYRDEMNMKEIGAIIGVNESRVSQILSSTAKGLRRSLI